MEREKDRGITDLLDWWSRRWSETQANKNAVSSLGLSAVDGADRPPLALGFPIWQRRRLVSVAIFNRPGSSLSGTLCTNRPGRFSLADGQPPP